MQSGNSASQSGNQIESKISILNFGSSRLKDWKSSAILESQGDLY